MGGAINVYKSGDYSAYNRRAILETLGIVFGGDYREVSMPRGVYDYLEKYIKTAGFAEEGLYCYNFCLNTDPFEFHSKINENNISHYRQAALLLDKPIIKGKFNQEIPDIVIKDLYRTDHLNYYSPITIY